MTRTPARLKFWLGHLYQSPTTPTHTVSDLTGPSDMMTPLSARLALLPRGFSSRQGSGKRQVPISARRSILLVKRFSEDLERRYPVR